MAEGTLGFLAGLAGILTGVAALVRGFLQDRAAKKAQELEHTTEARSLAVQEMEAIISASANLRKVFEEVLTDKEEEVQLLREENRKLSEQIAALQRENVYLKSVLSQNGPSA